MDLSPPLTHETEGLIGDLLRMGVVESVQLDEGTVRVQVGDILTAPVRWGMNRAGATRLWSPLTVGEQVLLGCPEGDIAAAVILGAIPCDDFPPAGNTLEEKIEYADGAIISYDPEGHILKATLPAGSMAEITSDLLRINGNVEIDGTVTAKGEISSDTDVLGDGISLKAHVHKDVAAGAALSGGPQ